MGSIQKFEELEIWKEARILSKDIQHIIISTNLKSDFALKDQIKRSSGSVMDNIAEGHGRGGTREFIQYLAISNGSCAEVRSQLYRCFDYGYIDENVLNSLHQKCTFLSGKIYNLISYLKKTDIRGFKY